MKTTTRRVKTPEQEAAAAERKAKFRALWKKVSDMPELERIQVANRLGIITCEGRTLSPGNQLMVMLQCGAASVVGGFRQWLKQGRCVMKGQKGLMIWVPTGHSTTDAPATTAAPAAAAAPAGESAENEMRFIIGTVFDISQTKALEEETATADNIAIVEFSGNLTTV